MGSEPVERIVPIIDSTVSLEKPLKSTNSYNPIEPAVDGIRLLILEPCEDVKGFVSCRLQHVAFTKKPKYEALSYTWGDETIRHKIFIDGQDFTAGQNLFDALSPLSFRREGIVGRRDLYHQSDVLEKNRQIGIMPFIYMRAKTVLLLSWDEIFARKGNIFLQGADKILRQTLSDNPYWKRVWIIQEVSLARKILVHYGAHKADWTAFIQRIQSNHDLLDSLPVKLQKELDKKYEDGHKLQALIESHRDSLCKDPRDHIYGFVGLAIDCQEGFPVDYGKSLYEVWKDVVRFKNAAQPGQDDYEEPEIDTLYFGKTVQTLLGGPRLATAEEVAQDISPQLEPNQDDEVEPTRGEILVTCQVAGKIVHLGPTYQEVMSNLKAMASWKAGINKYLFEWEQSNAREESELFLELLGDAEDEDLEIVASFEREITVPKPRTPDCLEDTAQNSKGYGENIAQPPDSTSVSTDPRLYLLGGVRDHGDASAATVGLAPSEARVGDYILLIHGTAKVVVVRAEEGQVRLVGTAAAAENHFIGRARKDEDLEKEKIFEPADLEFINSADRLDLFLDIATAYQLLG
ncbi:hypothetical protein BKA64DRAFT_728220 [Cadophora sp. MPI-SDFR-AT-0126]|nr:hypothetical protein BKA64DRAFT_728220 [Leotiomycetes sp. MPI-SDFR-AT-0126]